MVALVIAAGNRDPSRLPSPDVFELDRKATGVLAFGHGPHVCIGAALARLEGTLALRVLTQRFQRLERVPAQLPWRDGGRRGDLVRHHGVRDSARLLGWRRSWARWCRRRPRPLR